MRGRLEVPVSLRAFRDDMIFAAHPASAGSPSFLRCPIESLNADASMAWAECLVFVEETAGPNVSGEHMTKKSLFTGKLWTKGCIQIAPCGNVKASPHVYGGSFHKKT